MINIGHIKVQIHIIDLVVINVTIRGCSILQGMFDYETSLDNFNCQRKNKCGLIKAIILNHFFYLKVDYILPCNQDLMNNTIEFKEYSF